MFKDFPHLSDIDNCIFCFLSKKLKSESYKNDSEISTFILHNSINFSILQIKSYNVCIFITL